MTEAQVSFTCPRCAMTSYNPTDAERGYCGNCHDFTRDSLPTKADYEDVLSQLDTWHTARDVPPDDMNRLSHQLRYQAERLGLTIHVETNKQARTVSFITRKPQ
jgi:hypothetical protein